MISANSENGKPRTKADIERNEQRPETLPVEPRGIPAELKQHRRWVCWRWHRRKNSKGVWKWTKPPINPLTGQLASSTDENTWGTYQQAYDFYFQHRSRIDGIGFVLLPPYCGIDLDDSVDLQTGMLEAWVVPIVERFSSYGELSPSRTGIKILVKGTLGETHNQTGHIELYSRGRYFAITGDRLARSPATIEERQEAITWLNEQLAERNGKAKRQAQAGRPPIDLSDEQLIEKAKNARHGTKFSRLWQGDISGYPSHSEADLALFKMIAFWVGPDEERIDALFCQSGLYREESEKPLSYRKRTIAAALSGMTEFYQPRTARPDSAKGKTQERAEPQQPEEWEPPIPFEDFARPEFPLDCFSVTIVTIVTALAHFTQTPPDLAAMLILGVAGGALAKKFRVVIRPGWTEPMNVYVVVALRSGERKSPVFNKILEPVQQWEQGEVERKSDWLAEQTSKRRLMEARMKACEARAAKAKKTEERMAAENEAKEIARDLRKLPAAVKPQFLADDITVEDLAKVMAVQGEKMLIASPEGTAFEIASGRYCRNGAVSANFDIFLKGHCGDRHHVQRVGRPDDFMQEPLLSLALAVQPDVIAGIMTNPIMRGRGFLSRPLYSIPDSLVGKRLQRTTLVSQVALDDYRELMWELWKTTGSVDEHGKPCPHFLHFSEEAAEELARFSEWLEPQLGEFGELEDKRMADWANKLAGEIARIAGILHVMTAIDIKDTWEEPVSAETVSRALEIGKDYLLPHAKCAFGLMGADENLESAKRLLKWLKKQKKDSFTKREAYRAIHRHVKRPDDVDPILKLLCDHVYIRGPKEASKGTKPKPTYEVNPQSQNTPERCQW
jgi:hypothetical protein